MKQVWSSVTKILLDFIEKSKDNLEKRTPLNRYAHWKSVFPLTKFDFERKIGRTPTPQDILLAGRLSKENLLDLLRNFVVFDRHPLP